MVRAGEEARVCPPTLWLLCRPSGVKLMDCDLAAAGGACLATAREGMMGLLDGVRRGDAAALPLGTAQEGMTGLVDGGLFSFVHAKEDREV